MKPYRKNQVWVSFGEFGCLLEGKGLVINFPFLDSPYTKKRIEEYIEFLKLLLKAKE